MSFRCENWSLARIFKRKQHLPKKNKVPLAKICETLVFR